jgi:hypothetical protein
MEDNVRYFSHIIIGLNRKALNLVDLKFQIFVFD